MNRQAGKQSQPAWPLYLWLGLAILLAGQLAVILGVKIAATWHTPIMWTGYILLADGMLAKRKGQSWLTTRRSEFPFLLLISVLTWLVFEIYNFRLQNWLYRGLPSSQIVLNLGYFWSFATIMPAVFITAELMATLLPARKTSTDPQGLSLGPTSLWIIAGLAMVAVPPLLPIKLARFAFGFVWIGFIPLLDPINHKLQAPSLRASVSEGDWRPVIALLLAGFLCGLFWEAWNYQALRAGGGHWIYTVPDELRIFGWHYGEMPVLGLLGFPPFAIELYVQYQFFRKLFKLERHFGAWDISTG
jgi:hypothetical protein